MAEAKSNRVNTGTRTKDEDNAALQSIVDAASSEQGKKVVKENGQTFIIEKNASGMTIKTRIA